MREPIICKAGSRLNIDVTIDGFPTPKVKWLQAEGDSVDGMADVALETENEASRLAVASVTSQLAGKVKVVAENSVGADEAEFELIVKGGCNMYCLGSGNFNAK